MVHISSQILYKKATIDIAAQNRASLKRSVIVGRKGKSDLRDYLSCDANGAIYTRRFKVTNGALALRIKLENGTDMKQIASLTGIKFLDVVVEEEASPNGYSFKVLYGCGIRENGTLRMIRCALSEKKSGAIKWRLKRAPLYLEGLSRKQEIDRNGKLLIVAVENGLGDEELLLRWHVHHRKTETDKRAYVKYKYGSIYGFNEMDNYVLCRVFEAKGMIVARFYKGNYPIESEDNIYKVAILSKFVNGESIPFRSPKVVFDDARKGICCDGRFIGELKEFLLEKDPAETLKIGQRKPNQGVIRFNVNGNDPVNGGTILCCGYGGYEEVFGLAARRNGVKKAWFWPDLDSRDQGNVDDAIIPEGHVIGRRVDGENSDWEIVWGSTDGEFSRSIRQTTSYGNSILSDSDGIIKSFWQVKQGNSFGQKIKYVERRIRGWRARILMPDDVGDEVFSVSPKIGNGRFRLAQFWRNEADYENGEPDFLVRFIAFRRGAINDPANWMMFCAKLNEVRKFRSLMRGEIGLKKDELEEALFVDGYLRERYEEQLQQLCRAFLFT